MSNPAQRRDNARIARIALIPGLPARAFSLALLPLLLLSILLSLPGLIRLSSPWVR